MKTKTFIIVLSLIFLSTSALMAGSHEKKDIVDTAVSAGSFNTLVAALKAADLVDTIKGKGPFTVLHRLTTHLQNFQRELWIIC